MITINQGTSYKVGVNEIEGLLPAMKDALKPVHEWLEDRCYWTKVEMHETEYKSRDGFIPYSHNCGGVELSEIIPQCESHGFDFLRFGECDHSDCGYDPEVGECMTEVEGHLDAKLRVWLKFEGLEDGAMKFYLYLGGGNGDAPYFRTKHEATVFEASFEARGIPEFRVRARAAVKRLLTAVRL